VSERYSKVILTGGTGWLGRRLAKAITDGTLSSRGSKLALKCLVTHGDDPKDLLALGADIEWGDIRDIEACMALMDEGDDSLVIHAAGLIHPQIFTKDFRDVNVAGMRNILNCATSVRATRILVVSSNSVFGSNLGSCVTFNEQSNYNPYMGYGASKYESERLAAAAIESKGYPEITIVRPPWFYGPGQPARQTEFFRMVKDGNFPLMGDGRNKRSMGYIDSIVSAILLAAYSKIAVGESYWIADDRPYEMVEIVDTIKSVLHDDFGFKVSKRNLHIPASISDLARVVDGTLQSIGLYSQKAHVLSEMNQTIACDINKAKQQLGYAPLCDLREGMQASINWCLTNNQCI